MKKSVPSVLLVLPLLCGLLAACTFDRREPAVPARVLALATSVGSPVAPTSQPAGGDARRGAAGIGDPYFPNAGNGGYDALHYAIDLTIEVAGQRVTARTKIKAQATQHLRSFNLDFEQFAIDTVLVDGQPAEYRYQEDELVVTPAKPLRQGAEFTVEVCYEGSPGPTRSDDIPFGWFWSDSSAYVAAEPFGARTWYPANDHPLDKATYTFRVTVPKPFLVAANGLLTSTTEEDGRVTYLWQAEAPMASYLATVSVGRYEMVTSESDDGVPIVNFFPSDRASQLAEQFAATPDMIDYLAGILGPYPFESYGAIVPDQSEILPPRGRAGGERPVHLCRLPGRCRGLARTAAPDRGRGLFPDLAHLSRALPKWQCQHRRFRIRCRAGERPGSGRLFCRLALLGGGPSPSQGYGLTRWQAAVRPRTTAGQPQQTILFSRRS